MSGAWTTANLDAVSRTLRESIVEAVGVGISAHIGPAFSILEMVRVVFERFNIEGPDTVASDHFVLSKGHGALALYAVLAACDRVSADDFRSFAQPGSPFGGHPERDLTRGIECTTGSLGHGLPMAVGLALGARLRGRTSRVAVLVGDGELNEGSNWEALAHASKHDCDNLVVLVDHNRQQCHGAIDDVGGMNDLESKLRSFGCRTSTVDGHDTAALGSALMQETSASGPLAIVCRTLKARGLEQVAGWDSAHYTPGLSEHESRRLRQEIWSNFEARPAAL